MSGCTTCTTGSNYAPTQGLTAYSTCSTCLAGTFQEYSCTITVDTRCKSCSDCTPGSYRSGGCTGSSDSSCSACGRCDSGFYRTNCGGTSAGDCTGCPAFNYCLGEYNTPNPWRVTSCSAGSYLSTAPSASIDGRCTPCYPGEFCAGGTASKTPCPAGSYCASTAANTICPPGAFCPVRSTDPSQCSAGTYSTAAGASSSATCQQCSAGSYSGAAQSTTCSLCLAGTIGVSSGLTACTVCDAGSTTSLKVYQNIPGQTACKPCNQTQCATGTFSQACTNSQDRQCIKCTPPTNCIYSPYTEGCFVPASALSGTPSCSCIKGFEMMPTNPVYTCVQCPPGKFKESWNTDLCRNWTTPAVLSCSTGGMYSTAGTRTSDSRCTMFPKPPVNAYTDGLGWSCNAGYEKV